MNSASSLSDFLLENPARDAPVPGRVAPFLMGDALLLSHGNLRHLNSQHNNKAGACTGKSVTRRKKSIRGTLSTEALVAIGACFILILLVALTMRDKKPRFRFDSAPSPTPASTPATLPAAASGTPVQPSDLQALFVQGRADSPLIAPVDNPPFVTNTDYANPPLYREIREPDLGRMYATAPVKDRKALSKVAKVGGFRTPEAMAQAFGYPSVDQMISHWDQTIATTPQFAPSNFGTNSLPMLPY